MSLGSMSLLREDVIKGQGAAALSPEPRPIAYIMSRFPKISETFVLREILELEKQGQPVVILPLLRVQQPVRHAEAEGLISRAHYTPFLSLPILAANLHYLRRMPRTYLKTLWLALRGNWGDANLFVGAMGIFPKSVYYARLMEQQGIRHVHAHFATHPALAALIISELTGVGFSFTAHGHDVFFRNRMLDVKIDNARFAVTISEFNKEHILRLYPNVSAERIRILRCGVPLENYGSEGTRQSDDRFTILCVASLEPRKGVAHLVQACGRLRGNLKDFECLLVGDGEERGNIERLIDDLDLSGIVHVLGAQPQNKVADILGRADLFVLPCLRDALPVVLMEAMASGLPVVASRLAGIPELVEDEVTGLLTPPGDERALAEAITQLYEHADLRDRMGARGREKVAAEYDISGNVAKLRELFSSALDDRLGGGNWRPHVEAQIKDICRRFPDLSGGNDRCEIGLRRWARGGDSEVYEVTIETDGRSKSPLVLKLYRPRWVRAEERLDRGRRDAENEYAALSFLRRAFAERSDRFAVPRAFAHFPEIPGVLTEKCTGERMDHGLRWARLFKTRAQRADLFRQMEACGEWLGLFHSITEKDGSSREICARVERELRAEVDACRELGLDPGLARRVARSFEDHRGAPFREDLKIVGRHCDFAPWNIFVLPGKLTVIDFEGFQDGIIYDDVCYFLGQITCMPAYHLSGDLARGLGESFLDGYARHREISRDKLDAFMLVAMVKIMAHNPVLRGPATGWRDRWRRKVKLARLTNWFETHSG